MLPEITNEMPLCLQISAFLVAAGSMNAVSLPQFYHQD